MLKQTGMDREPQRSDQTPEQRQPLSVKPWSIIRNPLEAPPNHPKRSTGALSTNPLHAVHGGTKCMDRIAKSNRGGFHHSPASVVANACAQTGHCAVLVHRAPLTALSATA